MALSTFIKEQVEATFCLVYQCGENRDDAIDNLNSKVNHLITAENEAEYLAFRHAVETRYETK